MKKHLTARQERARELGRLDMANRCKACKRALPKVGALLIVTAAGETQKFCGDTCQQDYADALHTMEARRA